MVIDAHAHIGDYSPVIPGGHHSADELVELWDEAGVACGMISVLGRDPRASNDETRAACARFPGRLYGYVYLNPTDVDGSLRELDRWAEDECFRGVKLHPMNDVYYPFIEAYFPVYERIEALGLPMLWHSGTSPVQPSAADRVRGAAISRHAVHPRPFRALGPHMGMLPGRRTG